MRQKHRPTLTAIFLLGFYFLPPFSLSASAPTDQVRATVDQVLIILNNPELKPEKKVQERRDQLRQALFARFDFEEMGKRALGSHWRRRSREEQQEFVRLFTDLLENAYISRIEAYNNETLVYTGEKLDGQYAEVQSRMATGKGEEYSIDYKVRRVNSEWKVYDVVIENISLVNNYRSQFNRVITKSSYEDLISRLKEKQTETP
jgi:phospholipid transport system substrate-binding protein